MQQLLRPKPSKTDHLNLKKSRDLHHLIQIVAPHLLTRATSVENIRADLAPYVSARLLENR